MPERRGLPRVRPPRRVLPASAERKLTPRQREILDALEALTVEEGFAMLTMAQLAARVNCSLRTLYELAPSKDELLLAAVDRRLHRIGRHAMDAIAPTMDPLEALRAYLHAAHLAVGPTTEALARDLASIRGATAVLQGHGNYVIAVTETLLEEAIAAGQIPPNDTKALALVLGGVGAFFSRPRVVPLLSTSPAATADRLVDLIVAGLRASP